MHCTRVSVIYVKKKTYSIQTSVLTLDKVPYSDKRIPCEQV